MGCTFSKTDLSSTLGLPPQPRAQSTRQHALLHTANDVGLLELARQLIGSGVVLHACGNSATAATLHQAEMPFKAFDISRASIMHAPAAAIVVNGAPTSLVAISLPMELAAKQPPGEQLMSGLLRAAAARHDEVLSLVDPGDFTVAVGALVGSASGRALRKTLALKALSHCIAYDTLLAESLRAELCDGRTAVVTMRSGSNPQQAPASLHGVFGAIGPAPLPFEVLNGKPSYVAVLDALLGWSLVRELAACTGLTAAASIKHNNPLGAGLAVPLDPAVEDVFELDNVGSDAGSDSRSGAGSGTGCNGLSESSVAYLRARQAVPLVAFGGHFVAISGIVDASLVALIDLETTDGLIAPAIEPEALERLRQKRKGHYLVLRADAAFEPPPTEERRVFGCVLRQPSLLGPTASHVSAATLRHVATVRQWPPDGSTAAGVHRDLMLAQVVAKHAASNAVVCARDGQCIGIGCDSTGRADAVRAAIARATEWHMRHHALPRALRFADGVGRQERINARVRYVRGDMTEVEQHEWRALLVALPRATFSPSERNAHAKSLRGVALASDAFLPSRESIDVAAAGGVEFVVQTGGSAQDAVVVAAADEHKMVMAFSGVRTLR